MHVVTIESSAKNALSTEVMTSVREQLKAAEGGPVLLTGADGCFSAGLNLKEVASLDVAGMKGFLDLLVQMTSELFLHPGPTVAHVNGHAIAGGAVLAACCDWRVGEPNPKAKIGLNEVALGLRFPPRLLRMLRPRIARIEQVILEAGLYGPERAVELGLLDELGDRAKAEERLAALAANPGPAYAAAKLDLRGEAAAPRPEEEARFEQEVLPVWTSDALKERIRAALKR
jgi:enoyl-CoA hydratase/carnithine racemase